MATFLFNEIIFGPVQSRRLGVSLGINLLPLKNKLCNFNCIYCECGFTEKAGDDDTQLTLPCGKIMEALEKTLNSFLNTKKTIDTITFAGNGEPTLHPDFNEIIDQTILLRNRLFPNTKIAVLSNATLIGRKDIKQALKKVDYNILKIDSSFDETVKGINCPSGNFSVEKLIHDLQFFDQNLTLQTLFLKGNFNGFYFDNSSEHEVDGLLELYHKLKPKLVMIYTIDRDTPVKSLEKISLSRLNEIAARIEGLGIPVQVSA
jgi:wyosine [tRNA(Phe)-imidazoG37] synthetase (radical SAM superfamily)